MKRVLAAACGAVLLTVTTLSSALTTSIPPTGLPSAAQYGATLLPKVDGTVSWETLAEVKLINEKRRVVPKFSPTILGLDKSPVVIYGFIIPLNFGRDQRHFLLCPVPPHCPFCIPAGPEATIEVLANKRVPYRFEPILVSGTFSVVKDDPNGLLYRMTEASQVATPVLQR